MGSVYRPEATPSNSQNPYLPPEVLLHVFRFVEKLYRTAIPIVCKQWNALCKVPYLTLVPLNLKASQALRSFPIPASYVQLVYSEQALAYLTRDLSFFKVTIHSAQGKTKEIKFGRNFEPVVQISMINRSGVGVGVGVLTNKKFAIYDPHNNKLTPQHEKAIKFSQPLLFNYQFSQPSNEESLAFYNRETRSVYVYKDLTPQHFNLPLFASVRSIFLQRQFVSVLVQQNSCYRADHQNPTDKSNCFKKIGRAFKKGKIIFTRIEPVCSVFTYSLDDQSVSQEIKLPIPNAKKIVSDGCWIAAQYDCELVILSALTGIISHTIHNFPSDGSYFLQNQLLTVVIREPNQVKLQAWGAEKPSSSESSVQFVQFRPISLESLQHIEVLGDMAAVVINEQLIQFWKVTTGILVHEIKMESFSPESKQAFQRVSFGKDKKIIIQTYNNVYFMPL